VALYATNCSSSNCHGSLVNSNVRGATATQIQSAINNIGTMNRLPSLTSLTQTQIQEIADALR
jgi:N-acetylglucosamine-6-phosphate deacetylase